MAAQLSLLTRLEAEDRPRKRTRQVSRELYRHHRDTGDLAKRTDQVLRCLSWHFNLTTRWPTAAELARFMFEKGELPRDDSRLVAPRLTFLGPGEKRRGRPLSGGGLIEPLARRLCRVTEQFAHPWRVREQGTVTIDRAAG